MAHLRSAPGAHDDSNHCHTLGRPALQTHGQVDSLGLCDCSSFSCRYRSAGVTFALHLRQTQALTPLDLGSNSVHQSAGVKADFLYKQQPTPLVEALVQVLMVMALADGGGRGSVSAGRGPEAPQLSGPSSYHGSCWAWRQQGCSRRSCLCCASHPQPSRCASRAAASKGASLPMPPLWQR